MALALSNIVESVVWAHNLSRLKRIFCLVGTDDVEVNARVVQQVHTRLELARLVQTINLIRLCVSTVRLLLDTRSLQVTSSLTHRLRLEVEHMRLAPAVEHLAVVLLTLLVQHFRRHEHRIFIGDLDSAGHTSRLVLGCSAMEIRQMLVSLHLEALTGRHCFEAPVVAH